MSRYKNIILIIAIAGIANGMAQADAETTFRSYRCADGTNFIVGFYPYDTRAHMQIDGHEVTLPRRLTMSGARYSGGGVVLKITKTGVTTIRHAKRPETACELI